MIRAAFAAFLALAAAAPALAQEYVVVSGSRARDSLGSDYVIPHVGLTRRADFLLRTLWVSCDTRDADQRDAELRATLRGMLRDAGRDDAIELARLVQIDAGDGYGEPDVIVTPFTEDALEGRFASNFRGRSDTSYIQLMVKTPVGQEDSLEDAVGRLTDFVDGVEREGRSALDLDSNDTLSVVDPAQYREAIFDAMSADATARAAALGEGYGATFEGLENQVKWFRSDVLELRLFIPHRLTVAPAE
jgi:hypothetical protein